MNVVVLSGNLGKDAEIKEVGGVELANFSIATSRGKKNTDGSGTDITNWQKCQL